MNREKQAYEDAADIVRAIEQSGGLRASESEIIEKLRSIQLGWPAEREFMALSLWMGQCVLIHQLDKEGQHPAKSKEDFRVPDFFAIYSVKGKHQTPVLIEVKSSRQPELVRDASGHLKTKKRDNLVFTARYYNGLRRYADMVGLPLLVAWKIQGFGLWFLFDIRAMQRVERAYRAESPDIGVHDLLGVLVGNVGIGMTEGSKWVLEIQKLEEFSETEFDGLIERSTLISPNGREYSGKGPLFPVLALCETGVDVKEDGSRVIQSFYLPADQGVFAYRLFDIAVRGFGSDPIDWLTVIREERFQWSYSSLLDTIREGINEVDPKIRTGG